MTWPHQNPHPEPDSESGSGSGSGSASHRAPDAGPIRAALRENAGEPGGHARSSGAEALLTGAETTGDRPLLAEALLGLVDAYSAGAEAERAFVPFSRLLRMWDEDPGDFDEPAAHRLHRTFRWICGAMLGQPHIPLDSVETWHAAMAHRYRLAGYSERAVHQGEFGIARHLGDRPRAERAYAAWLAAPRDTMSGCHACELREQGDWQCRLGDDGAALRRWEPVLDGTHACLHEPHEPHGPHGVPEPQEPHGVLAASLLPLVRLGRTAEARAGHLRGYRAARSARSTRSVLAAHVEFCARTGNEPRGLEILAAQSGHWEEAGAPASYLDWTVCTAVLMRGLAELGHGRRPVPGPPGRDWTAVTLLEHAADEALATAARFDRRNGTAAVSEAARARMSGRPLVERLPLGLRPVPLGEPDSGAAPGNGSATATGTGTGTATGTGRGDPRALMAEARRLSERGHPAAPDRWREAEAAAPHAGTALLAGERAELLDHRAMELARTDPAAGAALFTEAAGLYAGADLPGDAVACRARAALAGSFAGRAEEALAELVPLCEEAVALHDGGRASTRNATAVLLSRARIRAQLLLGAAADPRRAAGELDTELAALLAFAEPHRAEPAVLARIAEATEARGRLAGRLGDPDAAARLLAEAARTFRAARRPWQATEAGLAHARALLAAGDPAGAEDVLRAAAAGTGDREAPVPGPQVSARLHLALAEALGAQGRHEEEAECFLEAAHRAGTADVSGPAGPAGPADDGPGLGAYARLRLGGCLLDLGRRDEAATVLEDVLPDLPAGQDSRDLVQARWWLGQALSGPAEGDAGHAVPGTGAPEHRAAAEQFLLAADLAKDWEDQRDHAMLAHLAADALKNAELPEEARQAYERAEELWRPLGETHAVVRALRSRAWIAMGRADVPGAIELMGSALTEAESGMRGAEGEAERTALRVELAQSYRQTAELLLHTADGPPDRARNSPRQYDVNLAAYQEAVTFTDHAAAAFAGCGEAAPHAVTGAQLMAGWLEAELGRTAAAATRARTVLDACPEGAPDPDGVLADHRREAAALLAAVQRED